MDRAESLSTPAGGKDSLTHANNTSWVPTVSGALCAVLREKQGKERREGKEGKGRGGEGRKLGKGREGRKRKEGKLGGREAEERKEVPCLLGFLKFLADMSTCHITRKQHGTESKAKRQGDSKRPRGDGFWKR